MVLLLLLLLLIIAALLICKTEMFCQEAKNGQMMKRKADDVHESAQG